MSNSIENDLNLDLNFLPSWAKESSTQNPYAGFEGELENRAPRRPGDRPPGRRRDGFGSQNRDGGGRSQDRRGPGGPRHGGPEGRPQSRDGGRPERHDGNRPPHDRRPPPPEQPLEIEVSFMPDEAGMEALARQIRATGRAYPLFDIARMILAKPERHGVIMKANKGKDGQVVQPIFVCALDDTPWLAEMDAINYVLDKHFNTFYQAEKTAIEPPKGTYTFVAQCGMSGVVLGPPNHHDYQAQLRRLHSERFSRVPFEVFKSRIKIVRDEAVVKKWIEDQSWRMEYTCLNMPEPLRLASLDDVRKHFRENHSANIIKSSDRHVMPGVASRAIPCAPLFRWVRSAWEEQSRFPLQTAQELSAQLGKRGLTFFKVNKTQTHVSVARPHYLDLDTVIVSDSMKMIVSFINAHPKCTRRQLLEALLPASATPAVPPAAPAAPTAPVADSGTATTDASATTATATPAAPVAAPAAGFSPEANAINSDLYWLVHQGHVIEFSDGTLETAKKPAPKPTPAPKATPAPAISAPAIPVDPVIEPSAPEASAEVAQAVPTAADASPESTEQTPAAPAPQP